MAKCAISLWSADLSRLKDQIALVEKYADYFHIDVGDGHYIPTLLFFPDLVKAVRPHTKVPFEVHLMTRETEKFVEPFIEAGADAIDIHLDACKDGEAVLKTIKAAGKQAGVVLAPDDDINALVPLLEKHLVDIVVCLGTKPGVKGKDLTDVAFTRIRNVKDLLIRQGAGATLLEADGGIRKHTVERIVSSGADMLVPGSLAFNEEGPETLPWLHTL
ncbi:MAG: ribulose-phosphate 3-epimerase [Spirochaetales bacterium]|jgi:ribulose-phosphate 3-epimerase|nr:ribulose-phosphate 3-epimerase [Spirochaetales bacterium]